MLPGLNILAALVSGQLLVLLFPGFTGLQIDLLAPIALVPLLFACGRETRPWVRFAMGELTGFIFWAGVCYWIRPTLAAYGGLSEPLSWLTLVMFAAIKALHTAVFALCAGWLMGRWWAIPAIAALWAGIERTHGTFGFAWLTLGNAAVPMGIPLRAAPLLGVYGVSFVLVMLNVGLALLVLRRPRAHLLWLLMLPGLYLLPELPNAYKGELTAVAMQPNLTESTPPDISRLANLSLAAALPRANLVVWPEMPAGFYWDRVTPGGNSELRQAVGTLARLAGAPVLLGAVTHTPEGAPLNSAVIVDPQGNERGRYSKTFLVPFGEFIPPMFGWITKISTEAGDFAAGDGPHVTQVDPLRVGTFICYEAAFPHLVRLNAQQNANVLVNISNDGWFFKTAAREQHLLLARMRAIENQRWVLRVTNDGITASIDPAGRVARTLLPYRETAGRLNFSTVSETTPYSKHGDWFAWICLALGLILTGLAAVMPHYQREREPEEEIRLGL
jgi:apolipoprotein N-acyltransferase